MSTVRCTSDHIEFDLRHKLGEAQQNTFDGLAIWHEHPRTLFKDSQILMTPLGFIANPKRFNVATTRAKSLMIIIGDPGTLMHDPHWLALLHYAKKANACCGSPMPELLPMKAVQRSMAGEERLQLPGGGKNAARDEGKDLLIEELGMLSINGLRANANILFSEASAVEGIATTRHDA